MRWRFQVLDPEDVEEAISEGLRSIERGDYIELRTQEDVRRFFADIVRRGKRRLSAKRRTRKTPRKEP